MKDYLKRDREEFLKKAEYLSELSNIIRQAFRLIVYEANDDEYIFHQSRININFNNHYKYN